MNELLIIATLLISGIAYVAGFYHGSNKITNDFIDYMNIQGKSIDDLINKLEDKINR